MKEREYASIKQMVGGLSQQHVTEPTAFERANYMKMPDASRHSYITNHSSRARNFLSLPLTSSLLICIAYL